MKWYYSVMRKEWSLWKKTKYVFLRTCSNLWETSFPIIVLLLAFASVTSFLLMKSDSVDRKQHPSPHAEAEVWVNQANIKAENIFCTGTEEYTGNDEEAQCVVTTSDKKLITLRCANVWVRRTSCRIEHLEK